MTPRSKVLLACIVITLWLCLASTAFALVVTKGV